MHAGLDAGDLLEHALHGQRVHHRGQHAHVVGARPLHAGGGQRAAAEDVAAADDQAELDAQPWTAAPSVGERRRTSAVDAEARASPISASPDTLSSTRR